MDVQSEFMTPQSALSFENINYYRAEDSGYHTSFAPGSFEQSDLSNHFDDSLSPRRTYVSPELNIQLSRFGPLRPRNDYLSTDTPPPRRGIKRPHPSSEVVKQITNIPTPTTLIAGQIESLEVNEDKENSTFVIPPVSPRSSNSARYFCKIKLPDHNLRYPNTPVKRNCKINPCSSAKRLDFSIHSLSCKAHELQPVPEESAKIEIVPILARPNQKIDIVRLLYENHATPPLENVLQYLNNEDTNNFCLVSKSWCQIWNLCSSKKKKQTYKEYLISSQENQENCLKENVQSTPIFSKLRGGCLREIHNELTNRSVHKPTRSPLSSPRSNKFKRFTKSASLDSRLQLSCVKCSHPAKVTEETSGEEWVECTNVTCSYQFCRSCNCNRHPGVPCISRPISSLAGLEEL